MMKEIRLEDFKENLAAELLSANFHLRSDISDYLNKLALQVKETQKSVVNLFIENNECAAAETRAICQDTGYVQMYVKIGQMLHLNFDLEKAASEVVETVYESQFLRKSLAHPVTRENTKTNTPVFFHYEITQDDKLDITLLLKGGGSENASKTGFLLPTASREEIENWVVEGVRMTGAKACPPYLIGVGIGGTLEKAVHNSKKLLLSPINYESPDPLEASLATSIKNKINQLSIGFQGLSFGETAMSVQVKCTPCHIATLPIALSIGCNAVRQAHFTL